MSGPDEIQSQFRECPLGSKFGLQWNIELQKRFNSSLQDSCKAETCRVLAADFAKRSSAYRDHRYEEKSSAARLEMEYFATNALQLTDNPDGINNYAAPSLHLASTFRNWSKQFKSSVSLDQSVILDYLSKKLKRDDNDTEEFRSFQEFLKTTVAEDEPLTIDDATKTDVEPVEEKILLKSEIPCSLASNGFQKTSLEAKPQTPTFAGSNRPAQVTTPSLSRSSSFGEKPKFGHPGFGPRPPVPAASAAQNRKFGGNFNNAAVKKDAGPCPPPPVFRTAHEELVAQAHQKPGREISNSSYGSSKKTLGVPRSGTLSSSFKPPIQSKDSETLPASAVEPSGNNDRLKHLDPKLVELIQSEIMDRGTNVDWSDIAGLDFVKVTVKEIVVFPLLRPDIFTGLRGPPKGLLLFGPPGTGKTLIGKCIACQSRSTFFSISASSLTSKWVGEGEKMVRTLFEVARVYQPSVVFIDEIDSLLSARSDTEHESSRRIKTEFLVQLDGATCVGDERILIVGATNRPQDLDEAARRRLVKRLYVPLPEQKAREQIIQNLLSTQTHSLTERDISLMAEKAEGYSGADMSNLCKEAAMGPIRSLDYSKIDQITSADVRPISTEDFLDAFKQVKASVSDRDLQMYLDWNEKFGAGK